MWTLISKADQQNYIMSLVTNTSSNAQCKFNLACYHIYSLLGVATAYNTDRTQSVRLYRVRNPWKADASFSGSFADGS